MDENLFSTLDADSSDDVPISLSLSTKNASEDAFNVKHAATFGKLEHVPVDTRWVLSCPQAAGNKTVMFSITRPANITALGAEWVQLFPKDSFENVTNEYEPFTFNDFGAKVPLFRKTTTGLTDDAPDEGVMHVYMEVKDQ